MSSLNNLKPEKVIKAFERAYIQIRNIKKVKNDMYSPSFLT